MAANNGNMSTKIRNMAQRKSVLFTTGGVIVGCMALAITNPGQPAYVDYASERLNKEFQSSCSELDANISLGSILKLPTRDLCKSFIGSADVVGRGAVKLAIDTTTQRKNLGIFSIYTTKIPGRTFKTIGIGRSFLMYYGK